MRRSLLALALPLTWPTAVPASTHWLCGLSEDLTRIVCVAEPESIAPAAGEQGGVVATVNGTGFPLDPRQTYQVPLWSPATEREPVEQLANATMCYRTPGCSVTLVTPMFGPALRGSERWRAALGGRAGPAASPAQDAGAERRADGPRQADAGRVPQRHEGR